MVGFRNIAVRNYQKINIETLRSILIERLIELKAFATLLLPRALT